MAANQSDAMENGGSAYQATAVTAQNRNGTAANGGITRVVLLYKRNADPDERLMRLLEQQIVDAGYSVFIDRNLEMGVEWAKEIESQIRNADAVVPLLSVASARSEMMGFEIEHAHEAAQTQNGRPRLLPIRINYTGLLPEPLAGILNPIQYFLWEGEQDDEGLAAELLYALQHLPTAEPATPNAIAKGQRITPELPTQPTPKTTTVQTALPAIPLALESIGGAVPLGSEFYLARPADGALQAALVQGDSIVLIKGARQIGKTSLLARGLQFAREQGSLVAFTDLQKLNSINLQCANNLYLTLAESLADQIELDVVPSAMWDDRRSPNLNFERFMRREVLGPLQGRLVWGLDEVDRLFTCPFGSEVFGLFRSWHNERALDPTGPWAKLTFAITYATEAHLFITDMNQSPFNVGTRLELADFTQAQVAELDHRYHHPLKDEEALVRFMRLLAGHPYLVRRGLHELATHPADIGDFELHASRDEGIYGDHLRRILVLLARDTALTDVVKGILRGQGCPTSESFYRLRSSGVMVGSSQTDVRPRCRLYAMYLKRHLLEKAG